MTKLMTPEIFQEASEAGMKAFENACLDTHFVPGKGARGCETCEERGSYPCPALRARTEAINEVREVHGIRSFITKQEGLSCRSCPFAPQSIKGCG